MMLMKSLIMSVYSLKRIARSRALVIALAGCPVALGAAGAMGGGALKPVLAWVGPLLCAGLAVGVLASQWSVDETTSLSAALRSSPMQPNGLMLCRVATAAALFVPQVIILTLAMKCSG